jgi:hypothetical protein
LESKVFGGKLEACTANDYKAGVKSLVSEHKNGNLPIVMQLISGISNLED